MSTILKTCFGSTYESSEDGIKVRDQGGPGHSMRRQFALVSPTNGVLASAEIQGINGDDLKELVDDAFRRAGFRPLDNRAPA